MPFRWYSSTPDTPASPAPCPIYLPAVKHHEFAYYYLLFIFIIVKITKKATYCYIIIHTIGHVIYRKEINQTCVLGAIGQRAEWMFVYVAGRWVENVNSPPMPHRDDVGPPMAWSAAGGESVCAGSVFAKSASQGCIMGHGVNAMTGSVQHMTERPVVVSTITDCFKWLTYGLHWPIARNRIQSEMWNKNMT